MSERFEAQVMLDHIHAEAVCQGIGERLRDSLEKDCRRAPQKLHDLYARLPELDRECSPSIAPSSHEAF